jgi:hypothetical protein
MQAMDSGKGMGGPYLGRTGLVPFGHSSMLLGGDQSGQGKVCKFNRDGSRFTLLLQKN